MTAANVYEARGRQVKAQKLLRAVETLLARVGVTDFAAEGLADLIAAWEPPMWDLASFIAGITICADAARGHRVCDACAAVVIADFRERPALAAAIARLVSQ